ncbi:hypothetical protein [Klebsiella pneumoniae]|nr:hypothetical protein [Klebsiella pneumoniae]
MKASVSKGLPGALGHEVALGFTLISVFTLSGPNPLFPAASPVDEVA